MSAGPDRLPLPPDDQLSPEQRRAAAEISSGPRGGVIGPFAPLLRNPELMSRLQKVGEYIRFSGGVSPALREFAILWIARHLDQGFEWTFHRPLALEAGLDPAVVEALGRGGRPAELDPAVAAVWDVLEELHERHEVSDELYARALSELGDAGLVEIVGVAGYYTTLALVMNLARTEIPGGSTLPARPRP